MVSEHLRQGLRLIEPTARRDADAGRAALAEREKLTSACAKSKVTQMPIPEPAPPLVTEQEIAGFCDAVAQRFQAGGVMACLVGGQACARYNLAQFSKDSDWLVLDVPELLLEIARRQIDFDTPDDLSWPTEYGSGIWNP